uniref:Si:dkey-181m9.8 n=1 Tax=Sander lucioperca TaxID=283035 RepID=A0A8D0AQR1_SANLU
MVWCGTVWNGMERYGTVLYGMVWNSMVLYCTVWNGMVRYCTVRCGTVWYGIVRYGYGVVRYSTVWYGIVRCGTVWYGIVRCGTVWYGAVRYSTVWYGVVRYSTVWYGVFSFSVLVLFPPQMAAGLPPDKAAIFLSLVTLEGRGFSPDDVMEAVRLSRDFPSALRFLSHCCPLCQDQVSFSKIITMTHCSCFLCETCFKAFFSAAIKERSIDQLVCPQCGRPEVKGHTGMEYFNLLDTQIRHFLSPEIHELFQRKLRDRALQEMPNFRWCAHCSFGMLHEADRLRMDCPSCNKSTCCQCRSAWSPEHQGVSCQQFRVWQQQNHPDLQNLLSSSSIECPECQSVFSLSRGGCLHFTCSQCQHQFCGGCSQPFYPGSACSFSADCGSKGLHAHHPRDCLYHLRDWSVSRLHLLLQRCLFVAVCLILELRDDGSRSEEPCGRPAPPEYRGHCQVHYKERLVELINRCRADPAVLFSVAEMKAELQRWNTAMPTRKPEEPEPLYAHRLRMVHSIHVFRSNVL